MAEYCLPKKYASAFLNALKAGKIDPKRLSAQSSETRRAAFQEIVGEEHATEVNALFESKMLLKNQQAGMVNWAKKISGISEPARKDIIDQINKLSKVLNPADQKTFLADLAARKLGTAVTADEAKQIYTLAQRAEASKAEMLKDTDNVPNRIAYGRSILDTTDYINSLKPNGRTLTDKLVDIASVPKSMLTSILHFSAPFVQGWGMISTARAWEGFGQMFKYFHDVENYRDLNAYIVSHPDFKFARSGGLALTDLSTKLSAREEAIQSTLVEKANQYLTDKFGIPNLVAKSSRAFNGYLLYVRFSRFSDLLNAARLNGEDVSVGSKTVSDIADVVNNFTGRGKLGPFEKSAPALNAIFFAPRKVTATMQMFNPVKMLNPAISPTARVAAVRQLSGSLLATGAVLGIAAAMGASVDPDPRSANFAKIDIGGEKLDMTGGNAIYLRLLARLATNQEITSTGRDIELGQGYRATTRADLVAQFTRGKLSPIAGVLADALYGKDPVGRPFSITQEASDKLMPITMHSFMEFAQNNPNDTAAIIPSLSAIFGVGLESPLPGLRNRRDIWGESTPTPGSDPANQALKAVGYMPNPPPKNIRGVKLNDEQYDRFQQYAGRMAKARVMNAVSQPTFNSMPMGAREEVLKKEMAQGREEAASRIMMENPDIVQKAAQAKQDMIRNGSPAAQARRAQ